MPYHIKTPSVMNPSVDVYYTNEDKWSETYADRKVYTTKSSANAVKATTVTRNGVTYARKKLAKETVD